MVLTRLSHLGEVCPLSDHSYSDPFMPYNSPSSSSSVSSSSSASSSSSSSSASSSSTASAVSSASSSSTSSSSSSSSTSSSSASTSNTNSSGQIPRRFPTGPPLCKVGNGGGQDEIRQVPHILDLPNEILEKIFSYHSYKTIGELRLSCKRFEQIGSNMLNTAFQRLQVQMLNRFQAIKAQMPRRESQRRKHPLAPESDIVETLHMRLTLLQMSFGKHIERKHCCFFAGDILDEVNRILSYIRTTSNLDRAYKVTDELFDLSTMAMEYFKEHIEPCLPEMTYFGSEFMDLSSPFSSPNNARSSTPNGRVSEPEDDMPEREALPPSNMVLRKRIRRIRQGMKKYNTQLLALKRELKSCKGKVADQHKQIVEYASRIEEYDKKFEESSRKFSTLFQELNKCKTELQYWRSKSPAHPLLCYNCGRSAGEWTGQDLRACVLVQNTEHAIVYVPLANAPDSVEKDRAVKAARDKIHNMGDTVRNLEHVFDLEPPKPQVILGDVKNEDNIASGSNCSDLVRESLCVSGCHQNVHIDTKDEEHGVKRRLSDEDSDNDDTVARRVRERKRIRMEV